MVVMCGSHKRHRTLSAWFTLKTYVRIAMFDKPIRPALYSKSEPGLAKSEWYIYRFLTH